MEFLFGIGLCGLLGGYLFLRGYFGALEAMKETWGPMGQALGVLVLPQLLWALEHPRRAWRPLTEQAAGLVLLVPALFTGYFFWGLAYGGWKLG